MPRRFFFYCVLQFREFSGLFSVGAIRTWGERSPCCGLFPLTVSFCLLEAESGRSLVVKKLPCGGCGSHSTFFSRRCCVPSFLLFLGSWDAVCAVWVRAHVCSLDSSTTNTFSDKGHAHEPRQNVFPAERGTRSPSQAALSNQPPHIAQPRTTNTKVE